ncbi:T9SS type A sorting domain-containing protein [Flavobacterium sp. XGLA_31]|uniref:T9SS type A sorting domain-containing protein n=1 Tax=Flavobacterium sp. XGLA_31 TaxID=3447666 RepID=UPI003F2B96A2
MKKITLLFAILCAWQINSQSLNQSASWPNPAWTITGSYNAGASTFESNPITTANFAYDDDDAGSGHEDNIAAESPVIDLTPAFTAGDIGLVVTVNYGYNYLADDILRFEYWDADAATWVVWGGNLPGNSTSVYDDFCTIPKTVFTTPVLSMVGFTSTQLSGFKYRIHYDDSLAGIDWNWGFCFDSPVISSVSCIQPTGLAANVTSATTVDLSWIAGGTETTWDIELVNLTNGETQTGTPTYTNITNPYTATVEAQSNYAFYVRSNCGASGYSSWSAAYTFNTTLIPGCATNLTPIDGAVDIVPGTVLFSWDAPTTGDPATSYDLYYGLTPGSATILVGNYLTTSASITITGYSTTFYWKIVPKNDGGSSTGCAEWSFTTADPPPPPANDECTGAIPLTPGGVYSDYITDGTTSSATTSSQSAPTTCFGFAGGDVWYSVVVPASGSLTLETGDSTAGATGLDTVFTIYSGDCGALTQIDCDDDSGAGAYSLKSITGQVPGSTLYIRVYEYNNDNAGGFGISAYDASLSNSSFDNANFLYYPNPVKNILNLSYSQQISNVEVFNLLGQKVISTNYSANQAQVDMSNLSDGAYMVKVTSAEQIKTIKVIKQ